MAFPRPRAALFLNPAAARGPDAGGEARAILAAHFELAVRAPAGVEAMRAEAREEARSGCPLLIAAGGDGTINLLLDAVAGTASAIGILPLGTANDLARQLGLPLRPVEAARRLVAGTARPCDVLAVNGRRFATVGGLGLVTECALSANRLKAGRHPLRPVARALGPAVYPMVALPRICLGAQCTWELVLGWTREGGEPATPRRRRAHAVFVANQPGLGGDLTLPGAGRNDDGVFELCVMAGRSRLRLLLTILALRMGWTIDPQSIGVHRASRVEIASDVDLGFLGDGELLATGRHFAVEVIPGGLAVVR